MQNYDKKAILKAAKQIVSRCSEYTPPKVKSSELNTLVAKAMLAIDDIIDHLNPKK